MFPSRSFSWWQSRFLSSCWASHGSGFAGFNLSWEGWLTSAPWLGALNGDGSRSEKSASFTFNAAGAYLIRASAVDSQGQWILSPELSITVTER